MNRAGICLIIILLVVQLTLAHEGGTADVRVVSANPQTRTYSFTCDTTPNNNYLRDWFIRPDSGDFLHSLQEEATIQDLPRGQNLVYTFKGNNFYHIGCIIVNDSDASQQWRGDMHIDLRASPWNPDIKGISGNALTATISCPYSGGSHTTSWQVIDASIQPAVVSSLPYTTSTITHTVAHAGLWDFICTVHDSSTNQNHAVGLPVEFFSSGPPYFPTTTGVAPGQQNNAICGNSVVESGEQCDTGNNRGSCPATCAQNCMTNTCSQPSQDQCYTSVQNIPVTCSVGSITQDTYSGCRTIICNSKQIKACDKNGFFEIYNEGGPSTTQLCLAGTCMTNQGYLKSNNYPICTGTPTQPTNPVCGNGIVESGEQCDTGNNRGSCPAICAQNCMTNTCSQSPQDQCYSKVNDMPLTCSSSITQDNKGGCRTVTCGGKQIMACDKNGFFEMYNQGGPSNTQICLAGTCMTNQGYIKTNTPACTGQTTPTQPTNPVCGNGIVESGEQCDTGNNRGNCPATCTQSCTINNCNQPTGQCYNNLQSLPATCDAGSMSDLFTGGCRQITCNGKQIKACEKNNFFEMYNQGGSSSIKICLGSTCMTNQGFIKSDNYPICS